METDVLLFVLHGMGRQDWYPRNVANLTAAIAAVCPPGARVHVRPIEYWSYLHGLPSTDARAAQIRLTTVPALRVLVNDFLSDPLYYFTPVHGALVRAHVVRELNREYRAFLAAHPGFAGGRVALVAHSMGGCVAWDILNMRHVPGDDTAPPPPPTDPPLRVPIQHVFLLGSPVPNALVIRGHEAAAYNHGAVQFWSIFHPLDPLGFRLEPLFSPAYAHIAPVALPEWNMPPQQRRTSELWHWAGSLVAAAVPSVQLPNIRLPPLSVPNVPPAISAAAQGVRSLMASVFQGSSCASSSSADEDDGYISDDEITVRDEESSAVVDPPQPTKPVSVPAKAWNLPFLDSPLSLVPLVLPTLTKSPAALRSPRTGEDDSSSTCPSPHRPPPHKRRRRDHAHDDTLRAQRSSSEHSSDSSSESEAADTSMASDLTTTGTGCSSIMSFWSMAEVRQQAATFQPPHSRKRKRSASPLSDTAAVRGDPPLHPHHGPPPQQSEGDAFVTKLQAMFARTPVAAAVRWGTNTTTTPAASASHTPTVSPTPPRGGSTAAMPQLGDAHLPQAERLTRRIDYCMQMPAGRIFARNGAAPPMTLSSSAAAATAAATGNAGGAVEFAATANEYIGGLKAHFEYWSSKDVMAFILDTVLHTENDEEVVLVTPEESSAGVSAADASPPKPEPLASLSLHPNSEPTPIL